MTFLSSPLRAFEVIDHGHLLKRIKCAKQENRPIGIAFGCVSGEIEYRIKDKFNSELPSRTLWIGIDNKRDHTPSRAGLFIHGGAFNRNIVFTRPMRNLKDFFVQPNILMNAYNADHWIQLVRFFRKHGIGIDEIMFEGLGLPTLRHNYIWSNALKILNRGGRFYGYGYFSGSDREVFGRLKWELGSQIGFEPGLGSFLALEESGRVIEESVLETLVRLLDWVLGLPSSIEFDLQPCLVFPQGSRAITRKFIELAKKFNGTKFFEIKESLLAQIRQTARLFNLTNIDVQQEGTDEYDLYHLSKLTDSEIQLAADCLAMRIYYFRYEKWKERWQYDPSFTDDRELFVQDEYYFRKMYFQSLKRHMVRLGFSNVIHLTSNEESFSGEYPYIYEHGTYDVDGGYVMIK